MDLSDIAHASFGGDLDLREAQSLLRVAAAMGRLGAWRVALDTMELHWSDEVRAIHEVPAGFTCAVEDAIRFYAPWARPVVAEAFSRCAREGRPYDLELQLITARGRWIWVRAIGEAERDGAGRIVRVLGAFQDITRQKVESERSRQLAQRLTMTLESLTDGFFTLDRDWRFTYLNSPAAKVLQCSRFEPLGRSIWRQFPEAVGGRFEREYRRAMDSNQPVEFEEYYEPLDLWVQVRAFPSPQGLAVSFRDVTAQVKAQQEVLRLNAELEQHVEQRTRQLQQAVRDLEAFSYSVSHDLRAPLAAITGFSTVIEGRLPNDADPRVRHALARIRAGAMRMEDLIEGMLSLADVSRKELILQPVDLSKLAHESIVDLRAAQPRSGVTVTIQPDLLARGDQRLMRQLVANLLGNAWKFTSRQPSPHIRFSSETVGGETVFSVSDDGPGFDKAYADKLFRVFERLHTAAEFPGTGIGLATVQRIVQRHGGRVWADIAHHPGARFCFTL